MEKNNKAVQATAGAKTAQSASATAQTSQPAVPAPAAKTLDQLIKERTEQIRKQSELADHREILLETKKGLEDVVKEVAKDVEANNYNTKAARIVVELGEDSYNASERLRITNPALIASFVKGICADIDGKMASIEQLLVA